MKITSVGIDLAKSVFSMHGIDEHGKTVLRRTVSRGKVMEAMAGIGPCLVWRPARARTTGRAHWASSGIRCAS
jgi:transposase